MRERARLTENARNLRASQTKAESLLWTALRGRRWHGLKFRRQHAIPPFIADLACVERKLIIEIDGGYHDLKYENDQSRQRFLESEGWTVLRFRNEDVVADVEAVLTVIARHLQIEHSS